MVSEKTDEEVAADMSLVSGTRLSMASESARKKLKRRSEKKCILAGSTGDRVTAVSLTWNGKGNNYQTTRCIYNWTEV